MEPPSPEINPDDYAQFVEHLRAYFEAVRASGEDGGTADDENPGLPDAMEADLFRLFATGVDRPLDATFTASLMDALQALTPGESPPGAIPGWAEFVARLFRYEQDFLLELEDVALPESSKTSLRRQMIGFFRSLARQLAQQGGTDLPVQGRAPLPAPQDALLGAISDPCCITDSEGRIRYLNPALRLLCPPGVEPLGTQADLWCRWDPRSAPGDAIRAGLLTLLPEHPLPVLVHRLPMQSAETLWLFQRTDQRATAPAQASAATSPPPLQPLQEENQRLRAIYRAWLALGMAQTEDDLLPTFLRRLNDVVPWGVAHVLLLDPQIATLWTSLAASELPHWPGLESRLLEQHELFAHQPGPGAPVRSRPLGLEGALAPPAAMPPAETLTLPLVAGDRVWGLLALYRSDAQPYSSTEVQAIAILTHGLAATWRQLLTNRTLQRTHEHLDRELRFARRVQRNFLPLPQPHPTLQIATRFVPASHLSGDFYLFDQPTEGPHTILIGDVAGHGLPAALMMTTMIGIFTELIPQCRARIDEMLPLANLACCQVLEENYFVTAQTLQLDARTRTWRLLNAGHPPPLLFRAATGTCEVLDADGLPLGMFPDARYAPQEGRWEPGDRIILCTDGLLEARDGSGRLFGRDQLMAHVVAGSQLPMSVLLDSLLDAAQSHAGGQTLSDDVALIGLQLQA